MSNTILSPNMNLQIPVPGTDPGPDYASNISTALSLLDSHNHTVGKGAKLSISDLTVNNNVPFSNFSTTQLLSTDYNSQSATTATLNSLYVVNGNLFFNDGAGDAAIQITKAGSVNATSSGISSGANSASFISNTLVVNAAATTPANIQAASILIGNNLTNSKFITLSPPSTLSTNYNIKLPSLPAANASVLTMDANGAMWASYPFDPAFFTDNPYWSIKPQSITGGASGQLAYFTVNGSGGLPGSNIVSYSIGPADIANGAITTTQISATANIVGTQLSSSANIVGTQLSSSAHIIGSQISNSADIMGYQLSFSANIQGYQLSPGANIQGSQLSAGANIAYTQLAAPSLHDTSAGTSNGATNTYPIPVQNQDITVTTNGRPLLISITPGWNNGATGYFQLSTTTNAETNGYIDIYNVTTNRQLAVFPIICTPTGSTFIINSVPAAMSCYDYAPSPEGSNRYQMRIWIGSYETYAPSSISAVNVQLAILEL